MDLCTSSEDDAIEVEEDKEIRVEVPEAGSETACDGDFSDSGNSKHARGSDIASEHDNDSDYKQASGPAPAKKQHKGGKGGKSGKRRRGANEALGWHEVVACSAQQRSRKKTDFMGPTETLQTQARTKSTPKAAAAKRPAEPPQNPGWDDDEDSDGPACTTLAHDTLSTECTAQTHINEIRDGIRDFRQRILKLTEGTAGQWMEGYSPSGSGWQPLG